MKNLVYLFITLAFFSCTSNTFEETGFIPDTTRMNLDMLQEGQTFRFALIIGDALGPDPVEEFYYTGDTLEIEVIEIFGDGIMISETITDNSPIRTQEIDYYFNEPNTYTNEWIIRNDSLIIGENSTTFRSHLLNRDILNLERIRSPLSSIDDWTSFIRDTTNRGNSFVGMLALNGFRYINLNLMYQMDDFLGTDGDGLLNVYSREDGIVRTFTFSNDFQNGFGWDRI